MKRLRRLTIIFFLIIFLLWTSFYLVAAADAGDMATNEFDDSAYLFYRMMIFPVHDIFFSKSVSNNNFIVILGYGINALFQTIILEQVINLIFPTKKEIKDNKETQKRYN